MQKIRQDPVVLGISNAYINFNGDNHGFLDFTPLHFPSVYVEDFPSKDLLGLPMFVHGIWKLKYSTGERYQCMK